MESDFEVDDEDDDGRFDNIVIPKDEIEEEKQKEETEDGSKGLSPNPKLDEFLLKWDRTLPLDRRCFGIKLCFAGADGRDYRDGLYRVGVRHILISYFYSRKWLKKLTTQEIGEDLGRFDFVFLDSGGFSFIQAINDGKDLGIDLETYTDEYYKELERFGHLFAGCAEVDVHAKFTQYQMEEFKNKLIEKNIPIVPVIQGQPVEQLKEMGWFEKFPYMAFGSAMIGTQKHVGDILATTDYGREHGNIFHGFGATASDVLLRSKFYSVDSTTWIGGSRFGNTMIFQNGRIRYYDHTHKDVRKRFKARMEENGIIWKDIEADKRKEVDLMNAIAWRQWADSIRFNIQNCYWLTPEEKDQALALKAKAFNSEGIIDRTKSLARAEARRLARVDDASYDDRAHEVLYCDTCFLSGRCTRYKATEPCGYDVNIRLETAADLHKAIQVVLEIEYSRVMTGALFEKAQGGVLDANVSNEMQKFLTMIQQAKVIFQPRAQEELVLQAKSSSPGNISKMLASVFAPTGVGGSGSGNTKVERAANRVINVTPAKNDSSSNSLDE
jgi:hypothetical protein